MNDEQLTQRLRRLETPVEPSPDFAESLFGALRAQAVHRVSGAGAHRPRALFAIATLAAAVVVAVTATMAIKLVDSRPQQPGVGPALPPTAGVTSSPSAAPVLTPVATSSPVLAPRRTLTVPLPHDYTELQPGRYSLNRQDGAIAWPASVTLDVPSGGWRLTGRARGGGLVKYPTSVSPDSLGQVGLWSVASLPVDVCADHVDDGQLPIGPSADDFIDALHNQRGLVVSDLGPVVIDGYAGRSLRVTPASDLNCPVEAGQSRPFLYLWTPSQGMLGDIWTARVPQYPNHEIHVLDVDGARYVIYTGFDTPELGAEIRAMLNSMDIVP